MPNLIIITFGNQNYKCFIPKAWFCLILLLFLMILRSKFTKRYVYNGLASKITSFTNFTNFTNFTTFSEHSWRIRVEVWWGPLAKRSRPGLADHVSSWAELCTRARGLGSSRELMKWNARVTSWPDQMISRSAQIRQECFEKVVKFVKLVKLVIFHAKPLYT